MGAAGVSVVGQLVGNTFGAIGESQEAQASAKQADRNAILSEYAAKDAEQRGAAEAAQITMKGTQTIGSARVAQAASGIELDSPVAQNAISTTRAYSALDALTTKSNAAREAYGYRTEGLQYKEQAKQLRKKSQLTPLAMFTGKSGGI